jgi:integrase
MDRGSHRASESAPRILGPRGESEVRASRPRRRVSRGSPEPWAARKQLRRTAALAGVPRRFAPHQLRHAHAIEMADEGVPLVVIQCQLGHANLGITSIYLQGIDSSEIITTVHSGPAPVISASAGLIVR